MMDGACCGPGYASPAEAIKAPREKTALYHRHLYRDGHSKTGLSCNG